MSVLRCPTISTFECWIVECFADIILLRWVVCYFFFAICPIRETMFDVEFQLVSDQMCVFLTLISVPVCHKHLKPTTIWEAMFCRCSRSRSIRQRKRQIQHPPHMISISADLNKIRSVVINWLCLLGDDVGHGCECWKLFMGKNHKFYHTKLLSNCMMMSKVR